LRIIGDAGPGDTRTSRDHVELEWKTGASPAAIEFADAPSGLYSKFLMDADGETTANSYELAGTVAVDGDNVEFVIHDLEPLKVSIDTSVALDPGKRAAVKVQLEIDSAFDDLDFSELPNNQGKLELSTTDRQMSKFRSRLKSAFVAID